MSGSIRIQIMGSFLIYIDDHRVENPVSKSRKGAALMECLVLHRGQRVPNQRLLRALWEGHRVTNPENALKTLISRARAMLNQMSPGLGGCIVSDRGAYHWQVREDVHVDALEIMDILDALPRTREESEQRALYQQLLQAYKGDLYQTGVLDEEAAYAQNLHTRYLKAVYDYLELLNRAEEFNEITAVCRTALEVDAFDDRLNLDLMKAMVNLNRTNDALAQYRHATNMTLRFLGAEPSPEMQEFYRQMSRARRTLKFNLDAIRNELYESSGERGAFVCDYIMFREIYNLQMRNLERLGTTMCLGIIMVGDVESGDMDSMRMESVMHGLAEILRENLRKGDIITHYAPTILAVLLPTVNYKTGTMIMERIQMLFYKQYSRSDLPFHYRLGMLGEASKDDHSDEEEPEA